MMVSSQIDREEWDRFVGAHPGATGYHLWQWRDVFGGVFGHECEYLAARRHGRVTGILPLVFLSTWWFGRFGISLPYVNYGGIVAEDEAAAESLIAAAAALARSRGLAHVELRHLRRQCPHLPVKEHKVTMKLALGPTADATWQRLDRKVRNQVRKAEKSGLAARAGGCELLPAFYDVFRRNMRDLGVPVHSLEFFQAVLAAFPHAARAHLVTLGEETVAGAVTFRFRNTVEVPWASSLREHLALCPNNLLYWSIIRQAVEDGADTLDFGRSTPNEGTFHFKKQWGAEPSPLFWEYQLLKGAQPPETSAKSAKYRIAMEAWKRMPVSVTSRLGPSLVRGMPY